VPFPAVAYTNSGQKEGGKGPIHGTKNLAFIFSESREGWRVYFTSDVVVLALAGERRAGTRRTLNMTSRLTVPFPGRGA
jgi:hypothetical protein